jgi:hypothetical protein
VLVGPKIALERLAGVLTEHPRPAPLLLEPLVEQEPDREVADVRTLRVVRPADPLADHLDDVAARRHRQDELGPLPLDRLRRIEPALELVHRATDDLRHAHVALDACGGDRIDARGADAVHELADARQRGRFAERRQDLLDVAHEDRVRADHEDAHPREPVAVRVEQVGGAVQSDGRLARPRPPLYDEHALQRGPDHLVLLALDRRDDVAHASGAGAAERVEQRGFAHEDEPVVGGVRGVEELVLEVDDLPVLRQDVPPPDDPQRVGRRGPVERLGGGGPPVGDQRLVVGVIDGDSSDVVGDALRGVDPSEDQWFIADLQMLHPAQAALDDGVALRSGRRAVGHRLRGDALSAPLHLLEPLVRVVDQLLLFGDLRGAQNPSPFSDNLQAYEPLFACGKRGVSCDT